MVSNVHANSAKRCKKPVQTVTDFRDKISFPNLPIIDNKKSLNKDSKRICEKRADLTSRKTSTSDQRKYNNETKVYSTINECKYNRGINNRSTFNSKNSKPSLNGSTMRIGNLDHKSMRKTYYRRKINHYKSLIKILMNVRAKDLSKTVMKETLRFSRGDDDVEFSRNLSAIEFGNDKPDNDTESDKTKGILSSKRRNSDVQTPEPKYAAGRKSIELSKTSGKIFGNFFTASTSKNVCNTSFENFDAKSTDCEMSFGKKRNNSDSDATIPNKIELFNKHSNSLDKIVADNKKVCENSAKETWLQKCISPFQFDASSDVAFDSHRESVKDTKILETAKKTGRSKSLMKKEPKIHCVELEEASSSVKKSVKVSFVNNESEKTISKKIEQRNSIGKNEIENSAVYIPDLAKGGKNFKDFSKPGTKSKKDEEAEKVSKKSEARNSNQQEFVVKSKATGNYCSCKRIKFKDVKTSGYSVPANIEYPALNVRKECGKRSTAVKSFENLISEKEKGKVSLIGEKKTEKFYSPLELEYSDVMKSKLDKDNIISNSQSNISRQINNDSTKSQKSLLKDNKVAIMKKCAVRVSEPLKKISNNYSSSKNEDETNIECNKNHSKSLKIPTFSKYSIPVSIEINMSKDDQRKLFLISKNLIQSKLTRYFPLLKLQNKNKVPDKSLNFNSTSDFEETAAGTSRISERKNSVGRSKSKSRSLPIIESDVLLKDTEKVRYLKNIPIRKPKLNISQQNYLYGVLNESETTTAAASNPNMIYRDNIKPVIINGKEKSRNNHDLIYIDDSNNSSIESIVPPSYSIFSDDGDNNNNQSTIIDINQILDTQQREDLLAPWESANNIVYL